MPVELLAWLAPQIRVAEPPRAHQTAAAIKEAVQPVLRAHRAAQVRVQAVTPEPVAITEAVGAPARAAQRARAPARQERPGAAEPAAAARLEAPVSEAQAAARAEVAVREAQAAARLEAVVRRVPAAARVEAAARVAVVAQTESHARPTVATACARARCVSRAAQIQRAPLPMARIICACPVRARQETAAKTRIAPVAPTALSAEPHSRTSAASARVTPNARAARFATFRADNASQIRVPWGMATLAVRTLVMCAAPRRVSLELAARTPLARHHSGRALSARITPARRVTRSSGPIRSILSTR
jgi:hypothetical protein